MNKGADNNKIWLKILLTGFYFFIFTALLYNSFRYLDPDFGWHLKMGEQIFQTRAVPDFNTQDFTLLGTHWVDHEWLAELFVYLIYHFFGYIALTVAFALLILAALIIQLQLTRKYFLRDDRGLSLVLILQAFGLFAASPHLGIRIQEITVIFLLLLWVIIFLYNKNKNFLILFWLIPLFIFWASAHGGFMIGLFLLGLFLAVKAAELWSAKKFPVRFLDYARLLSWRQIGIFSGFSLLSALATLLTPYGWHLYAFLLGYPGSFYESHLSEWQGQYCYPFVYPQLIYLEIVLIFLALLFLAVFLFPGKERRKIDLFDLALIVVFTGLAFQARRHFPLLLMVSLPIVSRFFLDSPVFRPAGPIPDGKKIYSRALINKFLLIFLAATLFIGGSAIAVKTDFTNRPESAYSHDYPEQAVAFLLAHPEWSDLRLFNDYGWGGYLIWQDPERKLFIDGRLPQFPLSGRTALEEYEDFFNPDKMLAQLRHYDIGMVLINPQEDYPKVNWWDQHVFGINAKDLMANVKNGFALLEYLRTSSAWRSVYQDGTAQIFVKN